MPLTKISATTFDSYFLFYVQYAHTYKDLLNQTHCHQFRWATRKSKHCSSSEGLLGADGQTVSS